MFPYTKLTKPQPPPAKTTEDNNVVHLHLKKKSLQLLVESLACVLVETPSGDRWLAVSSPLFRGHHLVSVAPVAVLFVLLTPLLSLRGLFSVVAGSSNLFYNTLAGGALHDEEPRSVVARHINVTRILHKL